MYKHAAEAFVPIPDTDKVREKICARSRDYCQHIGAVGADTLLNFDGGRATLRPTDEGLQLRVEATNLVTFYAIRTLLQGSLSDTATVSGEAIEWRPADVATRFECRAASKVEMPHHDAADRDESARSASAGQGFVVRNANYGKESRQSRPAQDATLERSLQIARRSRVDLGRNEPYQSPGKP